MIKKSYKKTIPWVILSCVLALLLLCCSFFSVKNSVKAYEQVGDSSSDIVSFTSDSLTFYGSGVPSNGVYPLSMSMFTTKMKIIRDNSNSKFTFQLINPCEWFSYTSDSSFNVSLNNRLNIPQFAYNNNTNIYEFVGATLPATDVSNNVNSSLYAVFPSGIGNYSCQFVFSFDSAFNCVVSSVGQFYDSENSYMNYILTDENGYVCWLSFYLRDFDIGNLYEEYGVEINNFDNSSVFTRSPSTDDIYNNGYSTGYTDGYTATEEDLRDAFNRGYSSGVVDTEQAQDTLLGMIFSIANVPFGVLGDMLSFEILGVNVESLIFGVLTGILVIKLFKIFI